MYQCRVEGKDVYVGLEYSKRTWKVCVRSEGVVVAEASMPASYGVLREYLVSGYPRCRITVMYEAGFRGFSLHDRLVADGYQCVVTPPHSVVQEKSRRVKCDVLDARRLAFNLEKGDYRVCYVPDGQLREDRQVSRTLVQVQKDITRVKNRIRKFLEVHGLDEGLPPGRWYEREWRAAEGLSLRGPLALCLSLYREELKVLVGMKRQLRKKLRELSRQPRYHRTFKLFCSAPGVGWFTAIRLVLEWGENLARFASAKQMASFTGLTCREFSTGQQVHRGRVTKQSNPAVRAWLIESAWTAYKRDPALLRKFRRVHGSTGSVKKAIVAVARVLAVRLRAIALSGEAYRIGTVAEAGVSA